MGSPLEQILARLLEPDNDVIQKVGYGGLFCFVLELVLIDI